MKKSLKPTGYSLWKTFSSPRLILIWRLLLGSIFIVAAAAKFPHQLEFIGVVSSYNILPFGLAQLYGSMLPWVELTIGCLLIFGLFSRLASGIGIALILSFITASVYAIFWGAASGNSSCGCFGEAMPLSHAESLSLNALMLLMAVQLVFCEHRLLSLNSSLRKFRLALKKTTGFALGRGFRYVTILLVMLILAQSPSLVMADARPVNNISSTAVAASSTGTPEAMVNTGVNSNTLEADKPTFVYFYADGCHYCQLEKPIIDELEQEYSEKIAFVRISGPDNQQAMAEYGVKGFPAMFLMTGEDRTSNSVYRRFDGLTDKETLKASFDDLLGKAQKKGTISAGSQPRNDNLLPDSTLSNEASFALTPSASGSENNPPLKMTNSEPNLSTLLSAPGTPVDPPGDVSVNITDTGFEPATVTIMAGQGVHWTNQSSQSQSVTANSSLFDSGELQPGAGFSIALAIPGIHDYSSTDNADFQGQVRVFLQELPGPPDGLASDHIPDMLFPPTEEADYSEHPTLAVKASRTRILLGFKPDTTVSQANAALNAAGTTIIGGLPDLGILLVQAPDTPDFSGLSAARDALRSQPTVEFAAMDMVMDTEIVPMFAESLTSNPPNTWTWEVVTGPDGAPMGEGGNWGLEASRFPQAWNWLKVIQGKNVRVRTAIVDNGFEQHKDLPPSVLTIDSVCRSTASGLDCSLIETADHGTHVAGIIGADFNNASSEANSSLGVSGANPVALINGVNWQFSLRGGGFAETMEVFEALLDAAKKGSIPNLRVINFSVGVLGTKTK